MYSTRAAGGPSLFWSKPISALRGGELLRRIQGTHSSRISWALLPRYILHLVDCVLEEYPSPVLEKGVLRERREDLTTRNCGESLGRREHSRYSVQALVNFEWTDIDGIFHRGHGITRDISSRGMYIFS